jgi:hypothetical protein
MLTRVLAFGPDIGRVNLDIGTVEFKTRLIKTCLLSTYPDLAKTSTKVVKNQSDYRIVYLYGISTHLPILPGREKIR